MRKEKWALKHGKQISLQPKVKNESKTLEEYLGETVANPVHRLELRLVRSQPQSPEFDETFMESFEVYKRYKMAVHKKENTIKRYKTNCVNSKLKEEEDSENADFPGYGSFHQQYILDGKIIAVGVLDVLPTSIISVYFFYDPEYSFLSLGTYSALRELQLTRELHKLKPNLQYYNMASYVHSCPKMRYKSKFGPAFLQCPKSYTWHALDDCIPELDKNTYCEFNSEGESSVDVNSVQILHKNIVYKYSQYEDLCKNQDIPLDKQEILEYANLVGKECAKRMLLSRK